MNKTQVGETMDANTLLELKSAVDAYARKRGGRIYAPIMHSEFCDIPSQHGHERYEAIAPYIQTDARTLLDIGSHWGYFAHRFEELGLTVTAVENSKEYLYFLRAIRDLAGKRFDIWEGSVFDIPTVGYDVVLALNIFHHFIKKESVFEQFKTFLNKLQCRTLIFQPHNPAEGQMKESFKNFNPNEFAEFVMTEAGMTSFKRIAIFNGRPIFLIS